MRWEDEEKSGNVEDRRGMPVSRGVVGGGIGTVILVLVALYFGIDPSVILQTAQESAPPAATQQHQQRPAGKDPMVDFVSRGAADTEKTWHGFSAATAELTRSRNSVCPGPYSPHADSPRRPSPSIAPRITRSISI